MPAQAHGHSCSARSTSQGVRQGLQQEAREAGAAPGHTMSHRRTVIKSDLSRGCSPFPPSHVLRRPYPSSTVGPHGPPWESAFCRTGEQWDGSLPPQLQTYQLLFPVTCAPAAALMGAPCGHHKLRPPLHARTTAGSPPVHNMVTSMPCLPDISAKHRVHGSTRCMSHSGSATLQARFPRARARTSASSTAHCAGPQEKVHQKPTGRPLSTHMPHQGTGTGAQGDRFS